MTKNILDFISKLEGYLTSIKSLHWASKNLPQHELCDKIADRIAEFQDQVSEVEQSINGTLPLNKLKGSPYKIKDLRTFVEDVLSDTNTFYKSLKGDNYIGMRSDVESFLSDMQRFLYLVDFTLKEELKRSLREAMYKNVSDDIEVDKFKGRGPKTIKARIERIYKIVGKYGINRKLYKDDHWQAIDDYIKVISGALGCEVNVKPCANLDWSDSMRSDGGYTDHDENGMPTTKQYYITITFNDGMVINGVIRCYAAGTVEDPFSAYDTTIALFTSNGRGLEKRKGKRGLSVESKMSGRKIIISEGQLGKMLSEEIINEVFAKMSDGAEISPSFFAKRWLPNEIEKLKLNEFANFFRFVKEKLPIAKREIKHIPKVSRLRLDINKALYSINNIGSTDAVFYTAKDRLLEPLKKLNEIFSDFKESMYNFGFGDTFSNKLKEEDGFDKLFNENYLNEIYNNLNNLVKELDSILKSACPDNPSIKRVGTKKVGIQRESDPSDTKPKPSFTKPSAGTKPTSTGGKGKRPRIPSTQKYELVSRGKKIKTREE